MDPEVIHARHLGIVRPDQLLFPVTVIGVGGIGSTMARLLSLVGFRDFRYYDPDRVAGENLGVQFYGARDVGKPKVKACRRNVQEFLPDLSIAVFDTAYTDQPLDGIIVVGVHDIPTRSTIWQAVQRDVTRVPLLVDGRTLGEEVHVHTIRPPFPDDADWYDAHLVPNPPGGELPCGEQGAPHAQYAIASIMANSIVRWVRQDAYWRFVYFNLRTMVLERQGEILSTQ